MHHTNEYTSIITKESIFTKTYKEPLFYDYSKEFLVKKKSYQKQYISRTLDQYNSISNIESPDPLWNNSECTLSFNTDNNSNENTLTTSSAGAGKKQPTINNDNNKISTNTELKKVINTPNTSSIWFNEPLTLENIVQQGLNCHLDIVVRKSVISTKQFTIFIHVSNSKFENLNYGFQQARKSLSINVIREYRRFLFTVDLLQRRIKTNIASGEFIFPINDNSVNIYQMDIQYHPNSLFTIGFNGHKVISISRNFTKLFSNDEILENPSHYDNTFYCYFGLVALSSTVSKDRFLFRNFRLSLLDNEENYALLNILGAVSLEELEHIDAEKQHYKEWLIRHTLFTHAIIRRHIRSMIPLIYLHKDLMEVKHGALWLDEKTLMMNDSNSSLSDLSNSVDLYWNTLLKPSQIDTKSQVWSKAMIRHLNNGFIFRCKFKTELYKTSRFAFIIKAPSPELFFPNPWPDSYGIGVEQCFLIIDTEIDRYGNGASTIDMLGIDGTYKQLNYYNSPSVGNYRDIIITYDGKLVNFVLGPLQLSTEIENLGTKLNLHNNNEGFVGFASQSSDTTSFFVLEQLELYSYK